MPVALNSRLQESNLECLGYSLRDWNLRAILLRLRQDRSQGWNWWAVQLESEDVDRRVWIKQDLEILDANLEDYSATLEELLEDNPRDRRRASPPTWACGPSRRTSGTASLPGAPGPRS